VVFGLAHCRRRPCTWSGSTAASARAAPWSVSALSRRGSLELARYSMVTQALAPGRARSTGLTRTASGEELVHSRPGQRSSR
jgi:hypothetical protein